jgi:hypothetical protein
MNFDSRLEKLNLVGRALCKARLESMAEVVAPATHTGPFLLPHFENWPRPYALSRVGSHR